MRTATSPAPAHLAPRAARRHAPRPPIRARVAAPIRAAASDAYGAIDVALAKVKQLPPSERPEELERATVVVRDALNAMKATSTVAVWDSVGAKLERRNVFPREFSQVGVRDAESIGRPSDANDAKFMLAVTMSTSALAVVVGATLPGDWGAFGAYLIGGISLAVLAVGSTAPGLLKVAVDRFSRINPEYRRRIARHEAGHFLVGYVMGVPVGSYDLGIDSSHVNFLEAKLERKIFQGEKLSQEEVLPLAVISMSGVAAEAVEFDEVMGQTADLYDLQRILNRVNPKLSDAQQQQTTRWAVWYAASILKTHRGAWDALTEKMQEGAPVIECLKAIENAPKVEVN
jgi:hypothetical protein